MTAATCTDGALCRCVGEAERERNKMKKETDYKEKNEKGETCEQEADREEK